MTDKTTKDKAEINGATKEKSKYWGITEGKTQVFEGTFEECWTQLHKRYPNATMTTLHENNIKISRVK